MDFTKYKYYDQSDPDHIRILFLGGGGGGPIDTELYYENGKWIFTSQSQYAYYTELKIIMNEKGQIEKIKIFDDEFNDPIAVEIAEMPYKTTYEIGDIIDIRGLTLKLSYVDGSVELVKYDFNTFGFDSVTSGDKTITVECEDLTVSFTVTVAEDIKEDVKIGDINGDGVLTAIDSNYLKRIVAGALVSGEHENVNSVADINGDGTVNAVDLNLLKRAIVGKYII